MEAEIKFEPSGRSGLVPTETYLFDAAARLGIRLEAECGRRGLCDSCAVKINSGDDLLCPPTKAETEHLSAHRRKTGERLSCQAKIEKAGEIIAMAKQKKQAEKPKEENESKKFRTEFQDLPLEKKVANLLELEAITLSETFSFVLNSPFKIVEKVMDVMAEFGLKLDDKAKRATRPAEHNRAKKNTETTETQAGETKAKKTVRKKATAKKSQSSSNKRDESEGET